MPDKPVILEYKGQRIPITVPEDATDEEVAEIYDTYFPEVAGPPAGDVSVTLRGPSSETAPTPTPNATPTTPAINPETASDLERTVLGLPPKKKKTLVDYAVDPLWEGPSRFARQVSESIDPVIGPEDKGFWKPFAAGATEGIGDVLSSLTSPLDLALTATGFGEVAAARRGYKALQRGAETATKALSLGAGAHGASAVVDPNSTLAQRGGGLAEMAGAGLGLRPRGINQVAATPPGARPRDSSPFTPAPVPRELGPGKFFGGEEGVGNTTDPLGYTREINNSRRTPPHSPENIDVNAEFADVPEPQRLLGPGAATPKQLGPGKFHVTPEGVAGDLDAPLTSARERLGGKDPAAPVQTGSRPAASTRWPSVIIKKDIPATLNMLLQRGYHFAGTTPEGFPRVTLAEAPNVPDAPARVPETEVARTQQKPKIRSVTEIDGTNRVWINEVEQTQNFGKGGPTEAEIAQLHRAVDDPKSWKRLQELKQAQADKITSEPINVTPEPPPLISPIRPAPVATRPKSAPITRPAPASTTSTTTSTTKSDWGNARRQARELGIDDKPYKNLGDLQRAIAAGPSVPKAASVIPEDSPYQVVRRATGKDRATLPKVEPIAPDGAKGNKSGTIPGKRMSMDERAAANRASRLAAGVGKFLKDDSGSAPIAKRRGEGGILDEIDALLASIGGGKNLPDIESLPDTRINKPDAEMLAQEPDLSSITPQKTLGGKALDDFDGSIPGDAIDLTPNFRQTLADTRLDDASSKLRKHSEDFFNIKNPSPEAQSKFDAEYETLRQEYTNIADEINPLNSLPDIETTAVQPRKQLGGRIKDFLNDEEGSATWGADEAPTKPRTNAEIFADAVTGRKKAGEPSTFGKVKKGVTDFLKDDSGSATMPGTTPAKAPPKSVVIKYSDPDKLAEKVLEYLKKGYVPAGLTETGYPRMVMPEQQGWGREAYELSRGMMSVDPPLVTSAAFRQGLPMLVADPAGWLKGVMNAAKSYKGGELIYDKINTEMIKNNPYLQRRVVDPATGRTKQSIAEEIGLAVTDLHNWTKREEGLTSRLAEKIPGYGRHIRASNRAFTSFLNTTRAHALKKFADQAKLDSRSLTGAKIPARDIETDVVFGRELAEAINTLTGRGKLTIDMPGISRKTGRGRELNLEKATSHLTDIFFSPKLMASRIRMLNPSTYINADPFTRKLYVKGLASSIATWWTIAKMGELAGGEIVKDPNSADFGKIKIGDTRFDPGAGLQQYLVLFSRIRPEMLTLPDSIAYPLLGDEDPGGGKFTSSTTGLTSEIGEGFKPLTKGGLMGDLLVNKLHPSFKFAWDIAFASEDRKFHVADRLMQLYLPMMAADLAEVSREDPSLFIPVFVASGIGMGAATYQGGEQGPSITPLIDEKLGTNLEEFDMTIPGNEW